MRGTTSIQTWKAIFDEDTHFFNLLFLTQFEINDMKQGWKILPHLHSLRTARKRLEPEDFDYLVDEMRWIFEEYCLFIPSVSRNRWISHSSQWKFKSSWIAFDSRGYRTDNALCKISSTNFLRHLTPSRISDFNRFLPSRQRRSPPSTQSAMSTPSNTVSTEVSVNGIS